MLAVFLQAGAMKITVLAKLRNAPCCDSVTAGATNGSATIPEHPERLERSHRLIKSI